MYDFRSFKRLLTKEQICTIPNYMSFARLVMIPFIIWTYATERYTAAVILLAVCELSDIADGIIARRCNMISELGKVLDPFCDKLMHGALAACLLIHHHGDWHIWAFFGFLFIKEMTMLVLGGMAARRTGRMHSARWYGKVSTVVVNLVMIALFLLPNLDVQYVFLLLCAASAAMLLSLVLYTIYWIRLIRFGDGKAPER